MKNKKIFLGIFFITVTLFFSCFQKQDTESDFIAEPIDGGKAVRIIEYIGSKWEVLIPSQIQNLPVTVIEENAFRNKNITKITIPSSVTYVGYMAFAKNQLTSVNIPKGVTNIGNGAFSENKLTSVNISNSVTNIGNGAFANNQLTSVNIPNSVTHIGDRAFSDNPIKSFDIPNNVAFIGLEVFSGDAWESFQVQRIESNLIELERSINQIVSLLPRIQAHDESLLSDQVFVTFRARLEEIQIYSDTERLNETQRKRLELLFEKLY